MKVLHVIQRYWPARGGAERHLHEINTRLVADGHPVTVYTTDADDFQLFWDSRKRRLPRLTEVHDGVAIRRFPVRHLPASSIVFPAIRRLMTQAAALPFDTRAFLRAIGQFTPWTPELRSALRTAGPQWDVVGGMTVTYDALMWPGAEWAERWGRPWLFYPLTHLGEGPRSAMRRYYTMPHQVELSRRARWVFAQTVTERAFLVEQGVSPDRIIVAGVGINLAEYGRGDGACARQRLGLTPETPLVLSLGTASRDKGTEDTLAAVRRLWATGHPVHLVVAGLMQDSFRRAYDRLPAGARARVHLLGSVGEADKQDLLAAADVLCMPSRADSFGIAYLEAWAYGKPVIGAHIAGIGDIIAHGEDGLLVPFGAPSALAEALADLLDNPARRASMGERGQAKVRRQYTWDQVYARVRPAYEASA
ncbi:MAG: glycosyltransferase family 4 protein [Anaerolineae bacterium]|nr:glycosyltransferase family 4 protein [Anaerolineae bacterium]